MDKLKGYLGLSMVALVAWLFLWPEPTSFIDDTVSATPLDRTAISQILRFGLPSFHVLARAQTYARRCPDGPATKGVHEIPGCDLVQASPRMEIYSIAYDVYRYDPGFLKALDATKHVESEGDHRAAWAEVDRRAIAAYPKLIPEYKLTYQGAVYALHLVFVTLLSFGLVYRRRVGGALLWPLTLVVGLGKRAHDQV